MTGNYDETVRSNSMQMRTFDARRTQRLMAQAFLGLLSVDTLAH